MDIKTAASQGIKRLRLAHWSHPMDHVKIDIIDGCPGPWVKIYSPLNEECSGADPVRLLTAQADYTDEYEEYTGPLPDSDEYKAAVAKCIGASKSKGG